LRFLPLAALLLLTWGLPLLVVAPRQRQKVLRILINLFTSQDTDELGYTLCHIGKELDGANTLIHKEREEA
jgi:hypothetical protein